MYSTVDLQRLRDLHQSYFDAIAAWRQSRSPAVDRRIFEAQEAYRRELAKVPGWVATPPDLEKLDDD